MARRVRWFNRDSFVAKGSMLFVLFVASLLTYASGADSSLPTARQLIAEALAACGDPKDDNTLPRSKVAVALAHLGDFASARKILAAHQNDIWVESGYWGLAEAEIQQSGLASEFPPALFQELPDYPHLILAKAYIKHGYIGKALEHVHQMPATRASSLHFLGHQVIEPLKVGGHQAAAREVLSRWAECLSNSGSLYDYKPRDWIEQLVVWLNESGESAKAKALCERWHAIMRTETDVDENGEFIGRGWAQLGRSLASIGEKNKSQDCLRQAKFWIDKARAAKFDPDKPNQCIEYAAAYAAVAARISSVLGVEAAGETYEAAYQHALMTITSKYEYYAYEKIVDEQLEADDVMGARMTVAQVVPHRSRGKCWHRICEYARDHGQFDAAKAAAQAAGQELDRDGFEPFMAHDMARVAAAVALANEQELARRLFKRAIRLSETNEDPKFDHPWIARMQVLGRLLGDAYETTKAIPDPEDRILSLAELALEVAKSEYLASKQSKPK